MKKIVFFFFDLNLINLIESLGTKDKTHEYILRSTFESIVQSGLHPRTQIQIVSQVMVDDGSVSFTTNNFL